METSGRTALASVGVGPDHAGELARLLAAVDADAATRARVDDLVALLTAQLGDFYGSGSVFRESDADAGPGRGAVPLAALLAVRAELVASLEARGVPREVITATLGEIGRQVVKGQRVTGTIGLADYGWVETVWRGGFTQVGRLQFHLIQSDGEALLNIHIPEGGALSPDAVRDSLLAGRALMRSAFPEAGAMRWAECDSWLLDPQLIDLLPGSNIAAFTALWGAVESTPNDSEALYFVFDLPRGTDLASVLDSLEAQSRLQGALLDHWRAGRRLACARGRMDLDRLAGS